MNCRCLAALLLGLAGAACDGSTAQPPDLGAKADACCDTSPQQTAPSTVEAGSNSQLDGSLADQSGGSPDSITLPPGAAAASLQPTATERSNARLVAATAAGTIDVVYYSNGVYHVRSSDNGATWTTAELIADPGRYPSIALDSKSNLHLVYMKGGIAGLDILHRVFDGTKWGSDETVYHSEVIEVSRPVLAIDKSDDLHCVWVNAKDTGTANSEVFYKKHTAGAGWSSTAENVSKTAGASEYPTVTVDSKNTVYVIWKDSGDNTASEKKVLMRRYRAGSGWDASSTNVSRTTGNGTTATMEPSAVFDSSDTLHLAWTDNQPGNKEIFYLACPLGDCAGVTAKNISNTSQSSTRPVVSLGDGGKVFVAWNEKTGGVFETVVYGEISGGTASSAKPISSALKADATYVNAPIRSGDRPSAIWTENEKHPFWIKFERRK